MNVAKHLGGEGLADINNDNIKQLLQSHNKELIEEELEELIRSNKEEDGNEEDKTKRVK